jgi:3-oxoacyl-[acyl-carrier-protein] synthase III
MGSKISSIGFVYPPLHVTNAVWESDFAPKAKILEQEFSRFVAIGVEQRYYWPANSDVAECAGAAGRDCLARIGFPADKVEHIIHMSNVGDAFINGDGPRVQQKIGATSASTIDLTGLSCTGFLVALNMAHALINQGVYKNVLISCVANAASRAADQRDVSASTLGDLAIAILVEHAEGERGVLGFCHETRGQYYDVLRHKYLPEGKRTWQADESQPWGKYFFWLDHREGVKAAQKGAVTYVPGAGRKAMERAGKTRADLSWLITHQPGTTPMQLWQHMFEFDPTTHPDTIAEVANCSFCTIPFTMLRMVEQGRLKEGQSLLMLAPASGQHAVGMVWRW